jgi:hypothetical protein
VRTVHWLFVVGVALFLSGLAFVIAGARLARQAPKTTSAASADVAIMPVASVKQIMNGIVGPAANRIFGAVGTVISDKGTVEKAPHTEAEWEAVGNDAAALIESGNLILMRGRAVDNGDWVRMTQAMIDAGKIVLRAAQAKSADKVFESGEAVNESCDNCHHKYKRGS